MTLPVLTALVLVFIVWSRYEIHKNSKQLKDDTERFWNREKDSNLTRRKDISALNYITVSIELLPMADILDQTANSYRDTILSLSGKKALNLSGYTNTELILQYGIANINLLIEYDSNYTILVSILQKWAERLYHQGYRMEALSVLEYAVSCHTEVTKSYTLLADLYIQYKNPDKINYLIDIVPETKIHDKVQLINALNDRKHA